MFARIPLSYYAFSGLLNFFASLVLSVFVISRNSESRLNRVFFVFALDASCWGLFHFLWLSTTSNPALADFYLRTVMIFVIFIPATFVHFILTLLDVPYARRINVFNYLMSFSIASSRASWSPSPEPRAWIKPSGSISTIVGQEFAR